MSKIEDFQREINQNHEFARVVLVLSRADSLGTTQKNLSELAAIPEQSLTRILVMLQQLELIESRFLQIGTGGTMGLFIKLNGVKIAVTATQLAK